MDRTELSQRLRERLVLRAERLGLRTDEISGSLDLVRSGLLDSLGFVDLITELEQVAGREVILPAPSIHLVPPPSMASLTSSTAHERHLDHRRH